MAQQIAKLREQLVLDAEAVRTRLLELKATKETQPLIKAAVDQNQVNRKYTVKALEAIEEVQETATIGLNSVSTLNATVCAQDDALKKLKGETARLDAESLARKTEVKESNKLANTAKNLSVNALNVAQKAQLAASQQWIVIKGVPAPQGKELYGELFDKVSDIFLGLNIANRISVNAVQRLPKNKDDPSPANTRVQLGGEAQRRLVFAAIEKTIEERKRMGDNRPYEYSMAADVPSYAKRRFKELNQLAILHRQNSPQGIRTRVSMKGPWPQLFVRLNGARTYEPAKAELLEHLRSLRRGTNRGQKRKPEDEATSQAAEAAQSMDNLNISTAPPRKKSNAGATGTAADAIQTRATKHKNTK